MLYALLECNVTHHVLLPSVQGRLGCVGFGAVMQQLQQR